MVGVTNHLSGTAVRDLQCSTEGDNRLEAVLTMLELVVIAAGIYVFRIRKKLFSYEGKEGDTYASANLRLAMVVRIWVHAVIFGAIMMFEV